jgi:hypothetical protein
MTEDDYNKLKDGDKVWFHPSYFSVPMAGVIITVFGLKGVWVSFFGEGCGFFPLKGEGVCTALTRYVDRRDGQ